MDGSEAIDGISSKRNKVREGTKRYRGMKCDKYA